MQIWKNLRKTIVCLFFFCTGCVSFNSYDYYFRQPIVPLEPLQGKLIDNKYYSPDDIFWVDIPKPAEHGFIIDGKGWVSFLNRYNYVYRLEVCLPSLDIIFLLAQHPEEEQEVLNALFSEGVLPCLTAKCPDTK